MARRSFWLLLARRLKTDAKDAATITDLLAQGHFVSFPFLAPAYADLRYLVTAREWLSLLPSTTTGRRWSSKPAVRNQLLGFADRQATKGFGRRHFTSNPSSARQNDSENVCRTVIFNRRVEDAKYIPG
jgi:hypothetical protein